MPLAFNSTSARVYRHAGLVLALLITGPFAVMAQQKDSLLSEATLPNIINYALERQPVVRQSIIDREITEQQVKSRLADWYPQINFNYLYQHNFQVQTNIIGGNAVQLGVNNTSALQLLATQNIFNRDLLLAGRTRTDVRRQAEQQVTNTKINVIANVSKAFYDVLATKEQINVSLTNITRLERSLKDATAQYNAGIVDKTDYKRATIALNNARALLKNNQESLLAKTEYLKSLIDYPVSQQLVISYDSATLENEIPVDTLQGLDKSRRIEFQQLQTQRRLQEANVQYNRWSYLPTFSANGGYIRQFLDDRFSKLYTQAFPQSYAGVTLGLPIFQGGKRKYNLNAAKLQLKRTELDIESLENSINSEYYNALAGYKSSLANYEALKENMALAQEVYDVINLQYRSGIRTYLEVVVAESDLRTAQVNYFNALYLVLSSKIDVQVALGNISAQ
ncbi:MAG: TolC family protein [Chitinophagaceae bacterium]|nr:MAG: TolC family protein [Chitinophagaceae bacterium]